MRPAIPNRALRPKVFCHGRNSLGVVRDCVDLKVDQIHYRGLRRADDPPVVSGYDAAFGTTAVKGKIIHECDVSIRLLFGCDQRGPCDYRS